MSGARFTCPCCGYVSFSEPPGSDEVCEICYWEDDAAQLLDPTLTERTNRLSLIDAQANFERVGACHPGLVHHARWPDASDRRDEAWRKAEQADRNFASPNFDVHAYAGRPLEDWYYWNHEHPSNVAEDPSAPVELKKSYEVGVDESVHTHFRMMELTGESKRQLRLAIVFVPLWGLGIYGVSAAVAFEHAAIAAVLISATIVPLLVWNHEAQTRKRLHRFILRARGPEPVPGEVELREDALAYRGSNHEITLPWRDVEQVNQTSETIEVVIGKPIAIVSIPKRIFRGPIEMAAWISYIEEHVAAAKHD